MICSSLNFLVLMSIILRVAGLLEKITGTVYEGRSKARLSSKLVGGRWGHAPGSSLAIELNHAPDTGCRGENSWTRQGKKEAGLDLPSELVCPDDRLNDN